MTTYDIIFLSIVGPISLILGVQLFSDIFDLNIGGKIMSIFNRNKPIVTEVRMVEPRQIWVDAYLVTNKDMKVGDFVFSDCQGLEQVVGSQKGVTVYRDLNYLLHHVLVGSSDMRVFGIRALVDPDNDADVFEWASVIDGGLCRHRTVTFKPHHVIIMDELPPKKVVEACYGKSDEYTDEDYKQIIQIGMKAFKDNKNVEMLYLLGYSKDMARYIVDHNKVNLANALASQEGLSMEFKLAAILGMNNYNGGN
jgi:hypothetical protein